ncbi:MAG: hypothetical protein Q7S49_01475 [bacterium]|nr:hypothetical protein [bacterium]
MHHANLLVGAPEEAESYLRSLCDSLDIKLTNNPDFFAFRTETFGIDEARELRLLSTRKAVAGRKIFFITPMRLTLEAQNALLKTFEDPSPDTLFFLAVREEGLIVPTLRSRMQALRMSRDLTFESRDAEAFLSSSIKGRLLFAKSFADEEKNLSVFLDDLLYLLKKQSGMRKSLEKVYNIKRSIGDSITIPRLVLEHLSLVL